MTRKHIRCKTLFTGLEGTARKDQTLIVSIGLIEAVLPTTEAPTPSHDDRLIDAGERVQIDVRGYDPNKVSDFNTVKWTELHTRERLRTLNHAP